MSRGFETVLIVGCGNMAGAMLRGWLAAGLPPARFTVADPAGPDLPAGVRGFAAIPAEAAFDAILLGIKPQLLANVAPQVGPLAGSHTALMSILAGVEIDVLQ